MAMPFRGNPQSHDSGGYKTGHLRAMAGNGDGATGWLQCWEIGGQHQLLAEGFAQLRVSRLGYNFWQNSPVAFFRCDDRSQKLSPAAKPSVLEFRMVW